MNKPPMNMSNPQHDWLDKILSGTDEYIHDAGFTEGVMNRLPARRKRVPRGIILGCAALLAVALFLLTAPDPAALFSTLVAFLYVQPMLSLAVLALATCTAASAVTYWILSID
jgi:hypothetical protein